jgi:hypothetical protein
VQQRTTPTNEPDVRATSTDDGAVVEREVETVTTRQSIGGSPAVSSSAPRTVASARTGRYFETLPERLAAVGGVLLIAIEGLLGMRFLLLAFGANPSSGFVGFIDDVSWPFVRPFANVFSSRSWSEGVVEVSTLVAMGVYFLIFALLGMLVTALAPRLSGGPGGGNERAV